MNLQSFAWIIGVPFSLVSIFLYYKARKENNLRSVKIYQPLTTILSLIYCFFSYFSTYSNFFFTTLIIIGMSLALIADFLNIDMTDFNVVIRGLTIFLIAYLIYTIATFLISQINIYTFILALMMSAFFIIVFNNVRKGMTSNVEIIAMGIYGITITLMCVAGINTIFSMNISLMSSLLLSIGMSFLFLGDIEFAISTYWKNLQFDYGPILYSGGQLLISISLFFINL